MKSTNCKAFVELNKDDNSHSSGACFHISECININLNKVLFFLLLLLNMCYHSTALDKVLFSTKRYLYFSYFLTKTYVVGTH